MRWGGPMWASAPTEALVGADDPVRPVPVTQHFVGQGPCALPQVRGKNPPVTALPCQPPLGKGAKGTGVADCHTSDIGHWFAMTGSFTWGAEAVGGEVRAPRPTKGYHGVRRGGGSAPPAGDRKGRPYGGLQGVRWAGRPQGPPLSPIFPLYTFLPPGFLTSLTMISAPHAADLDTLLIFNIF